MRRREGHAGFASLVRGVVLATLAAASAVCVAESVVYRLSMPERLRSKVSERFGGSVPAGTIRSRQPAGLVLFMR